MVRKRTFASLMAGFILAAVGIGCQGTDSPTPPPMGDPAELSLLALGDSYTVGHGIPAPLSWPHQLADSLAASGDTLDTFDVLAVTGWTTGDLLAALPTPGRGEEFGLVTLMIGVNNQFQGLDRGMFAAELDSLLVWAADHGDAVILFTIPDYGATPVGELFGAEAIAREIDAWNAMLQQVASRHGLDPLDVTALSRTAADDPQLVARDGLHYSAEMYRRWVSLMLPHVREALPSRK